MDVEHVEDCLMEKHIVLPDERWQLFGLMFRTSQTSQNYSYTPQDLYNFFRIWQRFEVSTYQLIRVIAQTNRLRRNYRLIRDWSHKRQWWVFMFKIYFVMSDNVRRKQLYYVFDTKDKKWDSIRKSIQQWHKYLRRLEKAEPPSSNPSRKAKIWSSLFTIHPICRQDICRKDHSREDVHREDICREAGKSHLGDFDIGCIICAGSFKSNQTLVQLHCDHVFHNRCVSHDSSFLFLLIHHTNTIRLAPRIL